MQFREYFPDPEEEDLGGKTPTAGHRRESHSLVQTIPGYTCPQVCLIMNQNVQGLTGEDKLEKTIELMIPRGIHRYFLQ